MINFVCKNAIWTIIAYDFRNHKIKNNIIKLNTECNNIQKLKDSVLIATKPNNNDSAKRVGDAIIFKCTKEK